MSKLLMIAPAPVIELSDGSLKLDVKFVDGMRLHVAGWHGPVVCILQRGAAHIPFGATYQRADLDFDLQIVDPGNAIPLAGLQPKDLIFAAADMFEVLHLADPEERPKGTKLIYSIEYDLPTRMRIVSLDRSRNLLRKIRSKLWLLGIEKRRRSAFRQCDGVQANGYPALSAYKDLNANTLVYLDGRMSADLMATPEEQLSRAQHLRSGAPLRLVHSGRLETMKGAQDLVPLANDLRDAKVDFTLDIFGDGSLATEMSRDIADSGLEHVVRMHGAVDFETELVPFTRNNADLFISCHLQSDPSCTYLETLGCGVPIVGYGNDMWKEMAHKSGGGWAVSFGDRGALKTAILQVSETPEMAVAASESGLSFAQQHPFEVEFQKRMAHLRATVEAP